MNQSDMVELQAAFAAFREDRLERLRIRVREKRASQLRRLLADSSAIDPRLFDTEVWAIESATVLHGQNLKGKIFNEQQPLSTKQIEELEQALTSDELELHGNYI